MALRHHHPSLTLEDQVFGVEPDPESPVAATRPPALPPPPADPARQFLLPLVAGAVVAMVVLWSLKKSVQYTELFQTNPKYQYALWSMNVAAIVLATAVLVCSARGGAGS